MPKRWCGVAGDRSMIKGPAAGPAWHLPCLPKDLQQAQLAEPGPCLGLIRPVTSLECIAGCSAGVDHISKCDRAVAQGYAPIRAVQNGHSARIRVRIGTNRAAQLCVQRSTLSWNQLAVELERGLLDQDCSTSLTSQSPRYP